jgi:glucose/arabinose dehydrogenase
MTTTVTCYGRDGLLSCIFFFFLSLSVSSSLNAQPVVSLSPVIGTGLSSPIELVNAGDGTNRLFVVQQGGTIRAYDASFNLLSVFVTVSNVNFSGERGLLSMVFHPLYSTNGLFFVYYVNNGGDLELARYKVSGNPNIADPASKVILITIPHPGNNNHNGGELHFGNDGYLYLSTGDGGGAGDVPNNAQNTSSLLGKILRFDVNTSATPPFYTVPATNPFGNEVYALGLRNPFRWSFDRLTNDMWIGDVGQNSFEELNFRAAGAAPGTNYGWRCYEASNPNNTGGCATIDNYTFPVYSYPTQSPASIVGGVVYRGATYPALQGYNLSADFYSGNLYKTKFMGSGGWVTTTQAQAVTGIAHFGEAENGEIYAVSLIANTISQVQVTGALPVVLSKFAATAVDNRGVQLNWQTSTELNSKSFTIEYSKDGISFSNLASIEAKNAAAGASYSYLHSIKTEGTVFYRLKMIDIDGSFKQSATLRVLLHNKSNSVIYPTIISDGLLHLSAGAGHFRQIQVISANGRVVYSKNLQGQTGLLTLPIGKLAAGMYAVSLQGDNGLVRQQIIIR